MTYNIRYIEAKCLNQIREEWMELQTGKEMTLFQSYQWNKMLLEHYVPTDTREYESIYAIVESDGHPCMIAPLWVIKNHSVSLIKRGYICWAVVVIVIILILYIRSSMQMPLIFWYTTSQRSME